MHSHTVKYIYNLCLAKDSGGSILSLADALHTLQTSQQHLGTEAASGEEKKDSKGLH